jgi:hypothetical protein
LRRFRNHGSDYLGTHDARCTVTSPCNLGTGVVAPSLAMMHISARCTNQIRTLVRWQRRTTTPTVKTEFQKSCARKKMLAPPTGSQPLPWWARGPLSVPYRLGTPAYRLQAKTKGKACTHTLSHDTAAPESTSLLREGSNIATCLKAPDPASLPRRALALPCVLRLRTVPHLKGWLRC